ncbi:MAG: hypothetical protein U1E05_25115, partial [Patescibacteria group bacterium]|nr:hypothetical protein [Patescibacteria group bacterium]
MNAVWFIFCIGLLNACLGFAIALHLGRRYRASLPPDWDFGDGLSWSEDSAAPNSAATDSADEPAAEELVAEEQELAADDDGSGLMDEGGQPTADAELGEEPVLAEGDREEASLEASAEPSEDFAERMQAQVDEIVEVETAAPPTDPAAEQAESPPLQAELETGPEIEPEAEPKAEVEQGADAEPEAEPARLDSLAVEVPTSLEGEPREADESADVGTEHAQVEPESEQ